MSHKSRFANVSQISISTTDTTSTDSWRGVVRLQTMRMPPFGTLVLFVSYIITCAWNKINISAFTIIETTRKSTHPYPKCSKIQRQAQQSTSTMTDQSIQTMRSLCGPFVIHSPYVSTNRNITNQNDGMFRMQWTLQLFDDDPTSANIASSAVHAWNSLHSEHDETSLNLNKIELTAHWNPQKNILQITWNTTVDDTTYSEMMAIVSRVFLQYTLSIWYRQLEISLLSTHHNPSVTIQIGTEAPIHVVLPTSIASFGITRPDTAHIDNNDEYTLFVRNLFQGLSFDTSKSELVEMVFVQNCGFTNTGTTINDETTTNVLGIVPRHWVHQYNLLHRGIGVLVTKDVPILLSSSLPTLEQQQPDIYCHQRTSTKRIFPSLYDMFIGGVSLVGESSMATALREVSEELGITTIQPQCLTQRLFQCIVCTSYNRCVVDVFGYTIHSTSDTIVWQEEEVAWGAFVPYKIVDAAAQLSIHRLWKNNQWPGRYSIQTTVSSDQSILSNNTIVGHDDDHTLSDKWKTWDFVPDGLLVWESWIQEQRTPL